MSTDNNNPEEPRQLVLDLPHRTALGAEDFLVSQSNEEAVAYIDRWPDWPAQAAVLHGNPGTGKSHLANVWCLSSGAATVEAHTITQDQVQQLGQVKALVVEGADATNCDERALFHLLNLSRERKISILMTSRTSPGTWEIDLPDLRSRARALPVIKINPPDDTLLKTILVKLFNDRQLSVEPGVINYLANRIDRSMDVVAATVDAIDKRALATGRKVTRALASDCIQADAA